MPELRFKRKKNTRMRSSGTHGGGSKKKRRGAGHRGGRGNAGSGKKADCKKQKFSVEGRRFGRFGFVPPTSVASVAINVGDLQSDITARIKRKSMKTQSHYDIDLTKMKVDKLLGDGAVTDKLMITVARASPSAVQKVEAAGGKVTLKVPADE